MTLSTTHVEGDPGHIADHNAMAAFVNTHDDVDASGTAHHHTLGTGASQAAAGNHTHTQAQSHNSPDTDSATTALHHTIGTGANQAAAGNHTHTVTKTVRISHTFSISGTLAVASGATNYIPPFYISVPGGTSATIAGIRAKVRAGSVTVNVTKNGTSVTGLSAVSVTTTAATTNATGGNTCADGDEIAIVLSSPSGADGLSVTIYLDKTV